MSSARSLPASGIRAVFDRAKELEDQGRRILHLEIGRPVHTDPPGVQSSVDSAIAAGHTQYVANRGVIELREAIAEDLSPTIGRDLDPAQELIVTVGASEAIAMTALALLGPGDELVVPEPAWNHYAAVATLAGATPVPLPLDPRRGYVLDPDALARVITPRTQVVIVNTPGNPTGAVQPAEALAGVAALADKHGFRVVADEVYRDFVWEGEHLSISRWLQDPDLLLYVNSFSKSYGMTGWRIGYVAASPAVSDRLNRVHQYLTVCGVPFTQLAAAALLRDPGRAAYLDAMRASFAERFAVWKQALAGCPGIELVMPGGAFYLFPRISFRGLDGSAFAQLLLEERGIAAVPGGIFGEAFSDHIRISYGDTLEVQREAAASLADLLHGL